jgi:PilZ domain
MEAPFPYGAHEPDGEPDRRRYRRLWAPIQCRLAGATSFAHPLEFIDVSFGGLRICCDDRYRIGARLHLDIFVQSAASVALTAEVVWVEPVRQGATWRFEVGLSFAGLNANALEFFMGVLDEGSFGPDLDEPVSRVRAVSPVPCDPATSTEERVPKPCVPPPGASPGDSERPTGPPPFDLEAFARKGMSRDSERWPENEPPTRPVLLETPEIERPAIASALLGAVEAAASKRTLRFGGDLVGEMRDAFSSGDYGGALSIADRILAAEPSQTLARALRADCCAALEDVYSFRLGAMDRVPVVARMPGSRDALFAREHRAGFLLSLVDGVSTLEAIVDVCGMPKLEALRILNELTHRGIVAFRPT